MGEIVRGRFLVTRWGPPAAVIDRGAVYVDGGAIVEAGDYAALRTRHRDAAVIGDDSHLLMPGLVNAHSHGRGITTLRLGIPDEPGEIRSVGLRRGLSVDPYADVLLGCVRQLEGGMTSTMHLDSNYGGPPDRYEERLTKILRAYGDSGIRYSVGVGIKNQNTYGPYIGDAAFFARLGPEAQAEVREWSNPTMPIADYVALFERLQRAFPSADLQFAPTNPDGCTDDLLHAIRAEATARRVRINIHLLETPYQRAHAVERWGTTGVEWLAKSGFLGPDVICAHCVWLTGRDVELMRDTGAVVAHNPSSNLRLRSGTAPIRHMADLGVTLSLGTDNLGINDDEDLLQEARLAQVLHSPPGLDATQLPAETVLGWATERGADVLGMPGLGRLEPGTPADLVLARLGGIARSVDGPEGVAAAVVQWLRPGAVDVVMVGGRVVVREGRYTLGDRAAIEAAAYKTVQRWEQGPGVKKLKESVIDLYGQWPDGSEASRSLRSRY